MNDTERDNLLLKLDGKIDKLVANLAKINPILFDTEGNPGLCSKVETQGKEIGALKIILAVLFGSGVLAGGGIWISKLLG